MNKPNSQPYRTAEPQKPVKEKSMPRSDTFYTCAFISGTIIGALAVVTGSVTVCSWHDANIQAIIAHEHVLEAQALTDFQKAQRDKEMFEALSREYEKETKHAVPSQP